jgi:ribosomal protein S18 acetylase RimI-like enzyme
VSGAGDIVILRARAEHVDEVAPLFDLYRQFYDKGPDAPGARAFMNQRLAGGDSVVFLARRDHITVGFTQLYPTFTSVGMGRVWHLNDLFVSPDCRRSGVARTLMRHAMEFARRTGALRVTLETARDNEPAQRLYEALGFERGEKFWKYTYKVAG